MKKTNVLEVAVLFLGAVLLLASCKKNDTPEKTPEILQSVVNRWSDQFKATAQKEAKAKVDAIIPTLNYHDGITVKQGSGRTIYLIRKPSSNGRMQYLALSESPTGIQAEGVYDVKNLAQVENFLTTRKPLPAGEQITVYSMEEKPLVQWETNAAGKFFVRMTQSRKMLASEAKTKTFSATRVKQILSAPPTDPNNPCLDWYWITFDPETGEIMSVDYQYTTCDGSNGGMGTTTGADMLCLTSALDDINQSSAPEDGDVEVTEVSATAAKRSRAYHWQIYKGIGWDIKSHETGIHEFSNSMNRWEWVSLTHSSVSVEGFWLGGAISCTVNTATPSVSSLYAGMSLNFTVKFEIACSGSPAVRTKTAYGVKLFSVNQGSL